MSLKNRSPKSKAAYQQLGKQAEKAAASYLQNKGFKLIAHNYRYKKAEIDLIVQKDDCLVFVEVKARTRLHFGYPETFLAARQQELIREAAEQYLLKENWNQAIRFDVIAVLKQQQGTLAIRHFEDAFY